MEGCNISAATSGWAQQIINGNVKKYKFGLACTARPWLSLLPDDKEKVHGTEKSFVMSPNLPIKILPSCQLPARTVENCELCSVPVAAQLRYGKLGRQGLRTANGERRTDKALTALVFILTYVHNP